MHWPVKKAEPLPNYRIYDEIKVGRNGIFDIKPYLDFGVFKELKDISYFNSLFILFGAITWPNGQDIAPKTLLLELKPIANSVKTA